MNTYYETGAWLSLRAYRQIMFETERSVQFYYQDIRKSAEQNFYKAQYLWGIFFSFVDYFYLAWFNF